MNPVLTRVHNARFNEWVHDDFFSNSRASVRPSLTENQNVIKRMKFGVNKYNS